MSQPNSQKRPTTSRRKLTTADIAVVALSAALIAVCSWISVPTAVPFTLQTFAVFLTAGLFGLKRSSLSVLIYILLAAVGIPVLAGMKGGFDKLAGATGGYILGFLFIALIVGFVSDRTNRRALPLALAMLLGLTVCYAFGTAWFMLVYARTGGTAALGTVLGWCVLPFIIPDCVKITFAVVIANRTGKVIDMANQQK